jgi:hypothetical protein
MLLGWQSAQLILNIMSIDFTSKDLKSLPLFGEVIFAGAFTVNIRSGAMQSAAIEPHGIMEYWKNDRQFFHIRPNRMIFPIGRLQIASLLQSIIQRSLQ